MTIGVLAVSIVVDMEYPDKEDLKRDLKDCILDFLHHHHPSSLVFPMSDSTTPEVLVTLSRL